MPDDPVVVVGGGHNGLVAACYLARLSAHTVPGVAGLYTCGASTAPVGGIAGSSGKAAALELLKAQP